MAGVARRPAATMRSRGAHEPRVAPRGPAAGLQTPRAQGFYPRTNLRRRAGRSRDWAHDPGGARQEPRPRSAPGLSGLLYFGSELEGGAQQLPLAHCDSRQSGFWVPPKSPPGVHSPTQRRPPRWGDKWKQQPPTSCSSSYISGVRGVIPGLPRLPQWSDRPGGGGGARQWARPVRSLPRPR